MKKEMGFIILFLSAPIIGLCHEKINIKGGQFIPLYGLDKNQKSITIHPFIIDKYPVTQKYFFDFIVRNPTWKKNMISSLYADEGYLIHWTQNKPSKKAWNVPATNVSWFSANAYCESQHGRLPTVFEWEYVAAASSIKKDASKDKVFIEQLLMWYSKPVSIDHLDEIGKKEPNIFGVYDLHGLIWEWVNDFNSVFVASDSRQNKDESLLFCGFRAEGTSDRSNYAAFIRYALRSSLKGNYTMASLGFRCAYDQ